MTASAWPTPDTALPLFPLRTVLFPETVMGLKVFEARYLDLVSDCMRTQQPFGVICLSQGAEAGPSPTTPSFEAVGVLAHIDEVDAEQTGILRVQCTGGQRFRLKQPAVQSANGLWKAHVTLVPQDPVRMPGPAMLPTVTALAETIKKLQERDAEPFAQPYRLDDAGWVANRWCELLPVPLAAKQKLMELDDPVIRLSLVDGYLRDKKVIFE
jgi:Lon protease-like protein